MTIPAQIPVTSSVANGVTTSFPYTFKILDAADLSVSVDDIVITTGFNITGVGEENGGNVVFDVAPTNGQKVIRYLDPEFERETDYQQFGDWIAAIVNGDFDRIWLALQFLAQANVRTIKMPVDTLVSQQITESAAERAGLVISFDDDGNIVLKTGTELIPEINDSVTLVLDAAASASIDAATATSAANTATTRAAEAFASAVNAANSAASVDITAIAFQQQTKTAFSTAGFSPTFTVTSFPLYGSYTSNERMRIKFNGNVAAVACTLNRDTLGAKAIKQYDSTGAKVNPIIFANVPYDLEYDGTDYVILNPSVPAYNSVLNLAGGQLKFPATQVSSSDANTLDDYEEGTFTAIDASGAALTFTNTELNYVKVGKIVYLQGNITFPTTSNTAAASILLNGLPLYGDQGPSIQNKAFGGVIGNSTGVKIIRNAFVLSLLQTNYSTVLTNANMSAATLFISGSYISKD